MYAIRSYYEGIDEVDALVIGPAAQRVGAAEDDELRFRLEPGHVEQVLQLRPGPLADRAPALDAIVPGNLGPLRQGLEFFQRERT